MVYNGHIYVFIFSTKVQGCWQVLSPTRKQTSYSDRRFWVPYILFIIIIGGILVLFMYITRLSIKRNILTIKQNKLGSRSGQGLYQHSCQYRGADKSLARPGRKQATATEGFDFIYPIYNHNWRNISTVYVYNKTSIKRNIFTIKQNKMGSRSG